MSKKLLKRVIATLCVGVMSMSCIATSVGAVEPTGDTKEKEAAFSLKYLDSLPKEGHKDFNKFSMVHMNYMDSHRNCVVLHKDKPVSSFEMNEEQVYSDIRQEVKRIEKKVDSGMQEGRVGGNLLRMANEAGFKINDEFSRKVHIAKEIYEWVANNIKYDFESMDDRFRKPQDALFVYEKKTGVCEGKANLINLMMRIAKIPSASIVTTNDKHGVGHVYNAIYLEDNNVNRTGWILLDSTWGAPESDADTRGYADRLSDNRLKEFFPAAYDRGIAFEDANKSMISEEAHKIESISMSERNCEKLIYDFKIDECTYKLCGYEGKSYIHVKGNARKNTDPFKILKDISDLGMKFEIGSGIESINLRSGEIVDISHADRKLYSHIYINSSSEFKEKREQYLKKLEKCRSELYVLMPWYHPRDLTNFSDKFSVEKANEFMKQMDKYMKEMDKAKEEFENSQSEFMKIEKEYDKKYREFAKWITCEKIDLNNETIKTNRAQILELKKRIEEKWSSYVSDVKEFKDLVEKFIKEMEKVKKEYEDKKSENGGIFTSISSYTKFFVGNFNRAILGKK